MEVPEEQTLRQVERTIRHVSREIRNQESLDPRTISALAKLISSYEKLIDVEEAGEYDYALNGDPHYQDRLERSIKEDWERQHVTESLEED